MAPDINLDIDVGQWTNKTVKGEDPQLDKAIAVGLAELKGDKSPIKPQPKASVRVPFALPDGFCY
ncbi:hypothetical protein [Alteromonas hispanica]|uniref:Uncharacterized protein n=1 Tax=Alteromonas hispanica TaxID=315421 RepID=A0A6L9MW34_9ALTE|nr:hypothetical protein [Alteromonas hispanica]NDW22267.1 hypothetical protein [Alteromonas hispanica]